MIWLDTGQLGQAGPFHNPYLCHKAVRELAQAYAQEVGRSGLVVEQDGVSFAVRGYMVGACVQTTEQTAMPRAER